MKKTALIAVLVLCLVLSACGIQPPQKTAEGTPWDADWTTLGAIMGVDPLEGWTLQRSEDVLAAEGMFYNVWTAGEAVTYTNENGDEVTSYEAEIHLVAAESDSAQAAQQLADDWNALTVERYPDSRSTDEEYAGQAFTVSTHDLGASATGTRDRAAIRVDVIVQEGADRDPAGILAEFLNHCHYAG